MRASSCDFILADCFVLGPFCLFCLLAAIKGYFMHVGIGQGLTKGNAGHMAPERQPMGDQEARHQV